MESGLDGRNNLLLLLGIVLQEVVSMESGLDGRNNLVLVGRLLAVATRSQWSPA